MKKGTHIELLDKLARKPHVKKLIAKAKANGKVTGKPTEGDTQAVFRKPKPRRLKDYEKRSKDDIWYRGGVVSGGGPGTGKRR